MTPLDIPLPKFELRIDQMNTPHHEMTGRALAFDESFTAIRMGSIVQLSFS